MAPPPSPCTHSTGAAQPDRARRAAGRQRAGSGADRRLPRRGQAGQTSRFATHGRPETDRPDRSPCPPTRASGAQQRWQPGESGDPQLEGCGTCTLQRMSPRNKWQSLRLYVLREPSDSGRRLPKKFGRLPMKIFALSLSRRSRPASKSAAGVLDANGCASPVRMLDLAHVPPARSRLASDVAPKKWRLGLCS